MNDETIIKNEQPAESETVKQTVSKGLKNRVKTATGLKTALGTAALLTPSFVFPSMNSSDDSEQTTDAADSATAYSSTTEHDEHTVRTEEYTAPDLNVATTVEETMTYEEAFAAARNEVGAGGMFEWHGHTYSTYYKSEWTAMTKTAQEQHKADVEKATSEINDANGAEEKPETGGETTTASDAAGASAGETKDKTSPDGEAKEGKPDEEQPAKADETSTETPVKAADHVDETSATASQDVPPTGQPGNVTININVEPGGSVNLGNGNSIMNNTTNVNQSQNIQHISSDGEVLEAVMVAEPIVLPENNIKPGEEVVNGSDKTVVKPEEGSTGSGETVVESDHKAEKGEGEEEETTETNETAEGEGIGETGDETEQAQTETQNEEVQESVHGWVECHDYPL